ncbi:MAG: triose-phosphate isomerase [Patescibacteria group bacterium]
MKKIIVANWKMNPDTPREARELFRRTKLVANKLKKVSVIVCPPAVFLPLLKAGGNVALGGQDASLEPRGAYTGSISAPMIKYAGGEYVILGHSERRSPSVGIGETDEIVNKKLRLALKTGLRVILCLGETVRDEHGHYLKALRAMLEHSLEKLGRQDVPQLIIAYEPVWAITAKAGQVGIKTQADTPESFLEHSLFIKKILANRFGQALAFTVPILYGGSVSPDNAAGFLTAGEADGLLVGHESLRADHLAEIMRLAEASAQNGRK